MLIKNAKVLIGKAFLDADIQFDRTITAVGKLDGPADLDAAGGYVDGGTLAALKDKTVRFTQSIEKERMVEQVLEMLR